MPRKTRIDMTGRRYGRLVGISFSHANRSGRAQWLFACDCGSETVTDGGNVRAGNTASCGCLHREISAARLTTHGHRAAKRHDPTYRAWQLINDSCTNPLSGGWKHCGARGVAVCQRWRSDFETFLADMGERPVGYILTRRIGDADFTPANCHWTRNRTRAERAAAGARTRRASEEAGAGEPNLRSPPAIVRAHSGARRAAVIQSSAVP